MSLNNQTQNSNFDESKYKTTLCRHFNTQKGCSLGNKCNFAHGISELRLSNNNSSKEKKINNNKKKEFDPLNYKIVKCKFWEKDGNCRYGTLCSFAHGDLELRSKLDNMKFNSMEVKNINYMNNPLNFGFDPLYLINLMKFQNLNIMSNNFIKLENSESNSKVKDEKIQMNSN